MGKQYLNGVLYGTGEIIKFSPYIYSLEEREVGVFTDGKPLYQKSYLIPNPIYVTTTSGSGIPSFTPTVVQDATMASIDKVASITGHWTRHSDYGSGTVYDLIYPINTWETTNIFRSLVRVNITAPSQAEIGWNYCIYTDDNISVAKNLFVTIQYTKTTDTLGSGHYTTNGGEAHHYSLTEQVIGTWVDGKPLYEKILITTVRFQLLQNTWVETEFSRGVIGTVVNCSFLHENPASFNAQCAVGFVNNNISFNSPRNVYVEIGTKIIIQYTKTTD